MYIVQKGHAETRIISLTYFFQKIKIIFHTILKNVRVLVRPV